MSVREGMLGVGDAATGARKLMSVCLSWQQGLPTPSQHPTTGEPMLMLHPCRTQEFMREALSLATASATLPCAADAAAARDGDQVKGGATGGGQGESGTRDEEDTRRYLVMWLSVFGGAVSLRLPLQLLAARR